MAFRKLQRVHYSTGRLLAAEDFVFEQNYFLEREKLHNQLLHGSGIVDGLEVSISQERIVIQPGCALDCLGNMICVPEVSEMNPAQADNLIYVVLHYRESETDQGPVLGQLFDSGEESTAPTRIIETFQLTYESGNPFQSHRRHFFGFQTCCQPHGVPLARLSLIRSRWSTDARFIAPRMKDVKRSK
jgi:hypothetical protein